MEKIELHPITGKSIIPDGGKKISYKLLYEQEFIIRMKYEKALKIIAEFQGSNSSLDLANNKIHLMNEVAKDTLIF